MQIGQLTGDGEVSKQSFNPDSDDDSQHFKAEDTQDNCGKKGDFGLSDNENGSVAQEKSE